MEFVLAKHSVRLVFCTGRRGHGRDCWLGTSSIPDIWPGTNGGYLHLIQKSPCTIPAWRSARRFASLEVKKQRTGEDGPPASQRHVLRSQRRHERTSIRVNCARSEVVRPWFQKLDIPAIRAIPANQRWNMDETGVMEGYGLNGYIVGNAEIRKIQRKQPGSRVWTTIIECISATGESILPLIIYKGKSVQQQWFPSQLEIFDNWYFTATKNGWNSDATAVEWLEKLFIPQTQPRDHSARLLILDGHGGHETMDFFWTCLEYNIYLLFLPAHTSHVLQPLDLTVFSSLKRAYRKIPEKAAKIGFFNRFYANGQAQLSCLLL